MDSWEARVIGVYGACPGPCLCCARVKLDSVVAACLSGYIHSTTDDEGEDVMALERRTGPVGMGGAKLPQWKEDDFSVDHPSLVSFLKDDKWSDGTPRVTGTISLFVQEGALKAAINDKDRGVVGFISAPAFYELLFAIDQGIEHDSIEWRPAARGPAGKIPPY